MSDAPRYSIGDVLLVKPRHRGRYEKPRSMRVKGFDGDLIVVSLDGHTYRCSEAARQRSPD